MYEMHEIAQQAGYRLLVIDKAFKISDGLNARN